LSPFLFVKIENCIKAHPPFAPYRSLMPIASSSSKFIGDKESVAFAYSYSKHSARILKKTVRLSSQVSLNKLTLKTHWKPHVRKITNNAIEGGCLQDDPHSCAEKEKL